MNPILVLSVVLIYIEAVLSAPKCNVPGVVIKVYKKGDDSSSSSSSGSSNSNSGAFTASVCPANKIAQIQLVDARSESTLTYTKCPSCAKGLTLQYDAEYCTRNYKDAVCKVINNVPGLSEQCFKEIRIYSCQASVKPATPDTTTPAASTEAITTTPESITTTPEVTTPVTTTPADTNQETTTPSSGY